MNPLQKKCVIATACFHLLLLVILFLGPGFFRQAPMPDALPVLKVIPLSAIEAAMTSGTAAATPPPAAQVQPPPQPQPVKPTPPTPEPKPVVIPPVETKPVETKPVETKVEPTPVVTKPEEQPTPDDKPSEVPVPKPKPAHKEKEVEADMTPVVRNVTKHPRRDTSKADEVAAEERAERAAQRERAEAFRDAATSLEHNFTASTTVEMPGESSEATANYGQIVKSIYENAWIPPDSADNDEASPKVRVVIARDGSVISAHIIEPSGDAAVDASVRRVLDRVTFIRAFSESAKENERTYIINFNLKAKRMLG